MIQSKYFAFIKAAAAIAIGTTMSVAAHAADNAASKGEQAGGGQKGCMPTETGCAKGTTIYFQVSRAAKEAAISIATYCDVRYPVNYVYDQYSAVQYGGTYLLFPSMAVCIQK